MAGILAQAEAIGRLPAAGGGEDRHQDQGDQRHPAPQPALAGIDGGAGSPGREQRDAEVPAVAERGPAEQQGDRQPGLAVARRLAILPLAAAGQTKEAEGRRGEAEAEGDLLRRDDDAVRQVERPPHPLQSPGAGEQEEDGEPSQSPGRHAAQYPGTGPRTGAEPQRGDRQPRQQREQRAMGNGERHPQRDQPPRRQRADPARGPVVGEQRRTAGQEQPQQAEHGDRQQGDPQGSPGQAVEQGAVVVRGNGGAALDHQRRRAEETDDVGAGNRLGGVVDQRPARHRAGLRERQGIGREAYAGGHPPGTAGLAERLQHEEGHGAEARPVVGAGARQLLRELVQQPLPRPGDRHAVRVEQEERPPPLPLLGLQARQPAEGVQARLLRLGRPPHGGGGLPRLQAQVVPQPGVLPPRAAHPLVVGRLLEEAGEPPRGQRRQGKRQDGTRELPLARRAQPEPEQGEEEKGAGRQGVREERRRHQAGDQQGLGQGEQGRLVGEPRRARLGRRQGLVRHFGSVGSVGSVSSIGTSTPRSRAQAIACG